jgi:hypothetical protein
MSHALLCLVGSILSFMLSYFIMKRLSYPEIKSEEMCGEPAGSSLKEGDECHVWDGSSCRRGTVVNNECVSEGSKMPMFFMLIGFILLIIAAFLYFKGKDGKEEKAFNFSGVNGKYRSW